MGSRGGVWTRPNSRGLYLRLLRSYPQAERERHRYTHRPSRFPIRGVERGWRSQSRRRSRHAMDHARRLPDWLCDHRTLGACRHGRRCPARRVPSRWVGLFAGLPDDGQTRRTSRGWYSLAHRPRARSGFRDWPGAGNHSTRATFHQQAARRNNALDVVILAARPNPRFELTRPYATLPPRGIFL